MRAIVTKPQRLVIAATLVVAMLGVLASIVVFRRQYLQPGEIVDRPGTYYSPHGRYQVTFAATPDGLMCMSLAKRVSHNWLEATYPPSTPMRFDAKRKWCFCFDHYERAWTYIGKWDVARGEQQRLRAGEINHRGPLVNLEGFWFYRSRLTSLGGAVHYGELRIDILERRAGQLP